MRWQHMTAYDELIRLMVETGIVFSPDDLKQALDEDTQAFTVFLCIMFGSSLPELTNVTLIDLNNSKSVIWRDKE